MSDRPRIFRYNRPHPTGLFIMPDNTDAPALDCVKAWADEVGLRWGDDSEGRWVICITASQKMEWALKEPIPYSKVIDAYW